jgi:hypothetical protein
MIQQQQKYKQRTKVLKLMEKLYQYRMIQYSDQKQRMNVNSASNSYKSDRDFGGLAEQPSDRYSESMSC